jgi:hypothetical protein
MKKYLLLYKILFLSLPGFAQLTISSSARWVTNGNVTVNLQDLDLVNNGTFTPGTGKVKFSGDGSNGLTGSSVTSFNELEIAKSGSNTLVLFSNAGVNGKITFTSGLIELNQKTINLGANAFLNNENENSRITGLNGGEVVISVSLNKPNAANPGNLGAILSAGSNLGTVTVKRGHKNQAGQGMQSSMNRYYYLQATGKKINAKMRLKYFDAELNGQNEQTMDVYQSINSGADWANISFNSRDDVANWVEKTSMTTFSLVTLSSDAGIVPPIVVNSGNLSPENKSTEFSSKKITVGPNPNNGNFWFKVSGIEKETIATLYTMDGKIFKEFRVNDLQQQQVNGLRSGMYILKVEGIAPFRILVQGDGKSINTNPVNNIYSIKN